MANRCYLEAYVPVISLRGEKKEYWDKYISKVAPQFKDIISADNSEVRAVIEKELKEFDTKKYPTKPYCLIDGEYYVHDEDITYKYCIPDQFIACFDKEDKIETNVNKEEYDSLSEYEKGHYDFMYKYFRFNSTAKKTKYLLEKHLTTVDKENDKYLEFGNQILDFLSSKDKRSIISLFSGEVCLEDSVESIYSYMPA